MENEGLFEPAAQSLRFLFRVEHGDDWHGPSTP
jgi:hypothetical protein